MIISNQQDPADNYYVDNITDLHKVSILLYRPCLAKTTHKINVYKANEFWKIISLFKETDFFNENQMSETVKKTIFQTHLRQLIIYNKWCGHVQSKDKHTGSRLLLNWVFNLLVVIIVHCLKWKLI